MVVKRKGRFRASVAWSAAAVSLIFGVFWVVSLKWRVGVVHIRATMASGRPSSEAYFLNFEAGFLRYY